MIIRSNAIKAKSGHYGLDIVSPYVALELFLFDFVSLTNLWGDFCPGFRLEVDLSQRVPINIVSGYTETHAYKIFGGRISVEDIMFPDRTFSMDIQELLNFIDCFEKCKVHGGDMQISIKSLLPT